MTRGSGVTCAGCRRKPDANARLTAWDVPETLRQANPPIRVVMHGPQKRRTIHLLDGEARGIGALELEAQAGAQAVGT